VGGPAALQCCAAAPPRLRSHGRSGGEATLAPLPGRCTGGWRSCCGHPLAPVSPGHTRMQHITPCPFPPCAQVIEYMLQCNEAEDEGVALEVGRSRNESTLWWTRCCLGRESTVLSAHLRAPRRPRGWGVGALRPVQGLQCAVALHPSWRPSVRPATPTQLCCWPGACSLPLQLQLRPRASPLCWQAVGCPGARTLVLSLPHLAALPPPTPVHTHLARAELPSSPGCPPTPHPCAHAPCARRAASSGWASVRRSWSPSCCAPTSPA